MLFRSVEITPLVTGTVVSIGADDGDLVHEGQVLILLDQDADELRGSASTVVGRAADVDAFVAGRTVLHRDGIGGLASVTVSGLNDADRQSAHAAGLELGPVSLQQLIVRKTSGSALEDWSARA